MDDFPLCPQCPPTSKSLNLIFIVVSLSLDFGRDGVVLCGVCVRPELSAVGFPEEACPLFWVGNFPLAFSPIRVKAEVLEQ